MFGATNIFIKIDIFMFSVTKTVMIHIQLYWYYLLWTQKGSLHF